VIITAEAFVVLSVASATSKTDKLGTKQKIRVDINQFYDLFSEEKEEEAEQFVDLPKEFISLANGNNSHASRIPLRYLQGRGITQRDILQWKIGYCPTGKFGGRIIVPSFSMSGRANYFIARSYKKGGYRYMNPEASRDIVFNQLYLDFDEDLTIVEGVFDAIIAGPNAVPILGSTLNEDSALFQEIVTNDTPVYIALDRDAKKKENRLIEKFLEYGIEIYKIDTTAYDDVGAMPKANFLHLKKKATLINSDNYLLYRTLSSL
jgi:DNA primase